MKIPGIVKDFLLRDLIKEYIEDDNFTKLYEAAVAFFVSNVNIGALTQVLYTAGIDPLSHIDRIPYGFLFRSSISSFSIPSHIEYISSLAFSESRLRELRIPHSVKTVGMLAVEGCPDLQKLTIPSSLQTVNLSAFRNNNRLTEVVFQGTAEQWDALLLSKAFSRADDSYITVTCSDAVLVLDPVREKVHVR